MFGLMASASAACALACTGAEAPVAGDVAFAELPGLTLDLVDYSQSARSPLQDLTGAGWASAGMRFGGADDDFSELRISSWQAAESARPGGLLPSEAFRMSDPSLSGQYDARALRLDLRASAFSADAGELDFDIGPRAALASGPDGRAAGAGVVARLGRNLEHRDDQRGWYLFAGAGAKAVTFDPRDDYMGLTDPQVERRAIVGDAQAGLAFDLGDADLALAYVRRERAHAKDGWGEGRHDGFAVISLNIAQ